MSLNLNKFNKQSSTISNESQKSQIIPKNNSFESELMRTNTDFNEVNKLEEPDDKKEK